MYRKAMQALLDWKKSSGNKCFLLTGCRGTGKTWLALDFAKNQYPDSYLYLNLEHEKEITSSLSGTDQSEEELIILDEVSDTPESILNELLQKFPRFRFLLVSSFPSACRKTAERFCTKRLYAMDFEEYLYATGSEWYVSVIQEHYQSNKPIPEIVHQELMDFFQEYLMTGGLPAAINELLNMGSTENHYMLHQQLIHQFYYDMESHLEIGEATKARAVWQSIPAQLARSNKIFRYRYIRKGATRKQYQQAIDYLLANQLIVPVYRYPENENTASDDEDSFKLYYPDVGLLNSTCVESKNTPEIKKGIYENYVALMLLQNEADFYFWESGSQARIDFIWKTEEYTIPVELRTDANTRSKSISVFRENHDIPYSIKLSTRNFDFRRNVKYLPVYAAFCLK